MKFPIPIHLILLLGIVLLAGSRPSFGDDPPLTCPSDQAKSHLLAGFAFQKDHNTDAALAEYEACLKLEPDCVSCLYEIGWSYWKKGEWQKVIDTWEKALKADPKHPKIPEFLPTARENLKIVQSKNTVEVYRKGTGLMERSTPVDAPVSLTLVGRWQSYNPHPTHPLDHFDGDIDSPKSAIFSEDGKTVYINSLEGVRTVIYDAEGLTKKGVIHHRFHSEKNLFSGRPPFDYKFPKEIKAPDTFSGKPVEGEITHHGRFLWVTYYRRHYDDDSRLPSAMALIDTASLKIIRVFGTGPIAKYVRASPDGKTLAVSNWGDNTVGLYDISGSDPSQFRELHLLVVEKRLPLEGITGDRDRNCGFCVRGLGFSADSRYLFVSRMKKGGIAAFDLGNRKAPIYLGTVFGINPGPRDLQTSPDGKFLYSSCAASGYLSKIPMDRLIEAVKDSRQQEIRLQAKDLGVVSTFAGLSVRSIKISPGGRYLFAAVNRGSEIQAFRTVDMKLVSRIGVDSYPVGLDISPDSTQIWVTSQGRGLKRGNSIGVLQIHYALENTISVSKDPRKEASRPTK